MVRGDKPILNLHLKTLATLLLAVLLRGMHPTNLNQAKCLKLMQLILKDNLSNTVQEHEHEEYSSLI